MFHRRPQTGFRPQAVIPISSSTLALSLCALTWLSPSPSWAQNLLFHSGNQLIGAQGGLNEFGNLSGDYAAIGGNVINGFPSMGSYSPQAVAASASLDWSYTQSGDVSTFTQSITQSQDGVDFGMAEHRFVIEFTAVTDLNFTFTSNYNGLSTAGSPKYSVFLFDQSTLGNVFADNSEDPNDLVPVENHSGMLIAGHSYALSGQSQVNAGGAVGNGIPSSASGTFVFTTGPVAQFPTLTSQIIAGPDRDNNNVIDTSIPVRGSSASEFQFTVSFDGAGAMGATITDTIPKEWELVSVTADDADDVIHIGGSGATRITHLDQSAILPPNPRFAKPTTYEWQPTDDAGVLTITVRTRAAQRGRFQPTRRGTYPLNTGAAAFNSDGTPLEDSAGALLVGPRLTIQAP